MIASEALCSSASARPAGMFIARPQIDEPASNAPVTLLSKKARAGTD
jgi:hypothetical protein